MTSSVNWYFNTVKKKYLYHNGQEKPSEKEKYILMKKIQKKV